MIEIRSYTNVWKVERMFYGVNDWHLPRPVRQSTVIWFGAGLVLSLWLKGIPPFIFEDSMLMNHVALPAVFAWLMGKVRLDGRNPAKVFAAAVRYFLRPRVVVRGKEAELEDMEYANVLVTIGRRKVENENEGISDPVS